MTTGVVFLIVDIALKTIQVHLAVAPGTALQCGIECVTLSSADGAAVVFLANQWVSSLDIVYFEVMSGGMVLS